MRGGWPSCTGRQVHTVAQHPLPGLTAEVFQALGLDAPSVQVLLLVKYLLSTSGHQI